MKRNYVFVMLLLGAGVVAGMAYAQGVNTGYIDSSVSVSSATTPVQVLPIGPPWASWTINERAANGTATAAATNVLVFPYAGPTVPAAVPSACASPTTTFISGTGCYEVTPTKPLSDAVSCDQPACKGPVGEPYAAVLESGTTAVIVDSIAR